MSFRALLTATILSLTPFGLSSAAQAEKGTLTIEQRLQRVEDELAIKRIITEYAVRLDARDLDGYIDLFAKDGAWQIGDTIRRGHDEIRAMLLPTYGNLDIEPYGYERYRIVSNMQVDIDGDRATARSRHLSIMRGENGSPRPTLGGLYEDQFIRENGQWKILHRIDYPIMPTAEEWAVQLREIQAAQAKQ